MRRVSGALKLPGLDLPHQARAGVLQQGDAPAKALDDRGVQCALEVAGVARTPTTPLRVVSAAGLTAGSMPTKGVSGKRRRRACRAAAEAVLQATTTSPAPCRSGRRRRPQKKPAPLPAGAARRAHAPGQPGKGSGPPAGLSTGRGAPINPRRRSQKCQSAQQGGAGMGRAFLALSGGDRRVCAAWAKALKNRRMGACSCRHSGCH